MRRLAILFSGLLLAGCGGKEQPRSQAAEPPNTQPTFILWAWDRYEDLRFLKPGEAEVAALLETIYLRNGNYRAWPRRLPLLMPEGQEPLQVVRLESDGTPLPSYEEVAGRITGWRRGGRYQIDFDARESQRAWYLQLIRHLRTWEPSISITALTSWCLEKPWFGAAADEVVPMLFQMGPQRNAYLTRLQRQGGFAPGCQESIGVSTAEPLSWQPEAKRVYVFHPQPWTRTSFDEFRARWR